MAWDREEIYLTLEGPGCSKLTPKSMISHLYNVKKKTEWDMLGYKIKIDKYG
ncbi:MAG: hypothetical protein HQK96_17355, partial [Nitrospirae bacterium]|nr:hypothetical protein [Nitrospirota bacterium]